MPVASQGILTINDGLIDVVRGPQSQLARATHIAEETKQLAEDELIRIKHGHPPVILGLLPTEPPAPPPKTKRLDYREDDAPLVEKIKQGVANGEYRGVWDGCLALASHAVGKGDSMSKAKRLSSRF